MLPVSGMSVGFRDYENGETANEAYNSRIGPYKWCFSCGIPVNLEDPKARSPDTFMPRQGYALTKLILPL